MASVMASAGFPALEGRIRLYQKHPSALPVFEVGPEKPSGNVVFIPGLTDGPLGLSYLHSLSEELQNFTLRDVHTPFRLLMPTLSSSYLGFGVSSLEQDVEEIDALLNSVPMGERKNNPLVLIGHSTGCQDLVRYMRDGANAKYVSGVIFQAPVSDREGMELEHGKDAIAEARALAEAECAAGRGQELMPRSTPGVFNTPITYERYASLSGRATADDMFSSDLTQDELGDILGHLSGVPCLWVFSGDDEYVPPPVKANYESLARRIAAAADASTGKSVPVIVEGGNHALDNRCTDFVCTVMDFIERKVLMVDESKYLRTFTSRSRFL
jgi:pimeloyl-ACP methyl ester carboxylesterase|mmetsp:Transcript_6971/g.31489  ORF Transcript_6971/g.31489 Transcript_6971/m.31489 type:complete len:327 (+) Transcript_6971:27-1007(+)